MLLYDMIRKSRDLHPDRVAIYFRDHAITYAELESQVRATAVGLHSRGVRSGDRVGILLPNCPEFTYTYFAAAYLGAVAVPANPLLKSPELVHIWGDSGVKAVITAAAFLPTVILAADSVAGIGTIVVLGDPGLEDNRVLRVTDLLAGPFEDPGPGSVDEHTPAVIIYTSGTTGKPKGALLSHANLIANCEQIGSVLEFKPEDNMLCVLPLFHSFGATVCQNASLYVGAAVTIVEQFQPTRILEVMQRLGVTIFPGVPAMYAALLQFADAPEDALSTVRLCVSGGAPMPEATMRAFEERYRTVIIEGDGPTECSPVTAVNPPFGIRKVGTIGLPVPGCEMRIFDDNDAEVPVGQVGEIVVRGPNVMLGYHNQPTETAEAMRNGWYHTGDLGHVDTEGYFSIVDRKKDMLIVGGMNVYPREVEEVLYAHPSVLDAAVIGAPDALRGDEVVAVVVTKPDAEPNARELLSYCRSQLAVFKVPRRVIFRDQLPRSTTGKVLKRLLRKELGLEGTGTDC